MKSEMFAQELNMIINKNLRNFVIWVLDDVVPDYFWEIPSSSTGKYHPEDEFIKGGLVLHTKRVANIAHQLVRAFPEIYTSYHIEDKLISACILHDTFKNGIVDSGNTDPFHPYYVRKQIEKNDSPVYENSYSIISKELFNPIMDAVEGHEGCWSGIYQTRCKDYSSWKHHVHLADYFASRRNVIVSL